MVEGKKQEMPKAGLVVIPWIALETLELIRLGRPGDTTITVEVGAKANKKVFSIHRSLLIHHSSFFRGALEGDWIEGKTKVVTLAEYDPHAFEVFSYWAYSQSIDTSYMNTTIPVGEGRARETTSLVECFILGDALLAPEFNNDVLDALIDIRVESPVLVDHDVINLVFSKTTGSSVLRRLIVDLWAWYAQQNAVDELAPHLPIEFVIACFQTFKAAVSAHSVPDIVDGVSKGHMGLDGAYALS